MAREQIFNWQEICGKLNKSGCNSDEFVFVWELGQRFWNFSMQNYYLEGVLKSRTWTPAQRFRFCCLGWGPRCKISNMAKLIWLVCSFLVHEHERRRWLSNVAALESAAAESLQSCPTLCNPIDSHRQQPTRLLHPWDYPGKNIGVGCHFLIQCM